MSPRQQQLADAARTQNDAQAQYAAAIAHSMRNTCPWRRPSVDVSRLDLHGRPLPAAEPQTPASVDEGKMTQAQRRNKNTQPWSDDAKLQLNTDLKGDTIVPKAREHTGIGRALGEKTAGGRTDDYFSMATAKADRARALSARTGPSDTWHSDDKQHDPSATFVYPREPK